MGATSVGFYDISRVPSLGNTLDRKLASGILDSVDKCVRCAVHDSPRAERQGARDAPRHDGVTVIWAKGHGAPVLSLRTLGEPPDTDTL
eukprot:2316551-Prymnesium_polylepis.1